MQMLRAKHVTPAALRVWRVPYSPQVETDMTTECFEATGPPPPPNPDDDHRRKGLLADRRSRTLQPHDRRRDDGNGADVPCGGTTGAVDAAPGEHTVGETAASGTNLAD